MANTGQLGTVYSQLGGIILGCFDRDYFQYGQAQAEIHLFAGFGNAQAYIECPIKFGQANASIKSRYNACVQTQAYILPLWLSGAHNNDTSFNNYLYVFGSDDGLTWILMGNDPAYSESTLRDTSIIYYNEKLWLAATGDGATTAFALLSTENFVGTWTHVAAVSTASVSPTSTWAPHWFVDSDGPHIFTALQTSGTRKIYELHPTNDEMTIWSDPVLVDGTGWPTNSIDPNVIKVSETYYMFYKNDDTSYINLASSLSLNSGYTTIKTGNWAGWGQGREAPQIVDLGTGTYRLYMTHNSGYNAVDIRYSETTDLTFASGWSATQIISSFDTYNHPLPFKRVVLSLASYAHGQAQVCIQGNAYGQAQAFIGHLQYAQAQAKLNTFGVNKYSQALAFIGHLQSGNAQAKLNAFDVNVYAQTQARIWHPAGFASVQARIKTTSNAYGQAQCYYLSSSNVGSAQGTIKQTYPLMSIDINYALTTMGAIASDSDNSETPINTIDGQDLGPVWEMMGARGHLEGETWIPDDEWIQVDLGQNRAINFYRILPFKYNGTKISLQYYSSGNWHDVDINITFSVDYFDYEVDASKAITNEITPITARIWRLLVTDLGDYGGIALATFELGWATVKSPTFAQAQVSLGHFGIGQSRVFIWPAYDVYAYGQAQASIITTYQIYGQAETWVIPPTVTGLVLADILQIYSQYGLVNSWVIPPTVIANAQVRIVGFNISHLGQAKADILQVYRRVAQAQTQITKFVGFGQALASIKDSYHGKACANARVLIGHYQSGSAMAYITKNWVFGQATTDIIKTTGQFAQASVFLRVPPSGQAKAQIKQIYNMFGQATALYRQGIKTANAQANIENTYGPIGQAQADIEQVYPRFAQAQVVIHIRYKQSGQARVVIAAQTLAVGQAMTWIGYHKFGQAQARLMAYGVPKFGLAGGYIIVVGVQPPPVNPSSDYYTYLVRFNGYNLPGYAQSESFVDSLSIASNNAPYMDASLSEDIGRKNISITIEMLIWEETYQKCKDKLSIAATILRISKDFAPLYIQRYDRYYMAIAASISASKSVPESPKTLKYTVEFEAKPWQVNIDGSTTAPVPPPIVIPPELLPPPVIPPSPSTVYREVFGLSKAKIISFQTIRTGLVQVKITRTQGYGSSQALITKRVGFAQARTRIRGAYRFSGQAQAKIVRKMGFGQARVFIATLPGPPTNLVAAPGDARVTLSWNPPAYG